VTLYAESVGHIFRPISSKVGLCACARTNSWTAHLRCMLLCNYLVARSSEHNPTFSHNQHAEGADETVDEKPKCLGLMDVASVAGAHDRSSPKSTASFKIMPSSLDVLPAAEKSFKNSVGGCLTVRVSADNKVKITLTRHFTSLKFVCIAIM
jgi:hypothetical protein